RVMVLARDGLPLDLLRGFLLPGLDGLRELRDALALHLLAVDQARPDDGPLARLDLGLFLLRGEVAGLAVRVPAAAALAGAARAAALLVRGARTPAAAPALGVTLLP